MAQQMTGLEQAVEQLPKESERLEDTNLGLETTHV